MAHVEHMNFQRSIVDQFQFHVVGVANGQGQNPRTYTLEELPNNLQQMALDSLPYTQELMTMLENGNLNLPPVIYAPASSITPLLREN
jgi:hypothetical protein